MARELSGTHTRLVIGGDDTAPTECSAEYRVEDGDLAEEPKAIDNATPNFNQTATALCAAEIATVKTAESIT